MSKSKLSLVYESEGSHKVFADRSGALSLEVLVGTVALYAVRMKLTAEETARFRQEGGRYIDTLAAQVSRNEADFRAQGRTQPV